jgi:hypothetical protein
MVDIIDIHKKVALRFNEEQHPIVWELLKKFTTKDETNIYYTVVGTLTKEYLLKIPNTIIDLVLANDYTVIQNRVWTKVFSSILELTKVVTLYKDKLLVVYVDLEDPKHLVVMRGDYFSRVYRDDKDPFAIELLEDLKQESLYLFD